MDIDGKDILVLGGGGLVGVAVCRELLERHPASLAIASRRQSRALRAVEQLKAEFPGSSTGLVPVWGDVFVRAEWQGRDAQPRAAALGDPENRRRLIADILDPLDDDIVEASMLAALIEGRAGGFDTPPAKIVIDCMNTATAVSYQNVYASARRLAGLDGASPSAADQDEALDGLLASLYVPQLVRHVQLLYESMRRAATDAYVKVGTTGTGGMGFNIPYTHGEEKPSRLLLSKAAVAGAQSQLTFLLARTPGGPSVVKEIKPAAVIGWREIGYGPIRSAGGDIAVYDCRPEAAVSIDNRASIAMQGDFGEATGDKLQGVYIDTGENGLFSAGEFAAITALGQMELVTPEEIARHVVDELRGSSTGRDVVGALDGAVAGPSYRAAYLREAAVNRLRQLEAEHGESVAFEILGPPRLSKLLFEACLLKRVCGSIPGVLAEEPDAVAAALARHVCSEAKIRQRMISIGIPILLPDGKRLLRGPRIKSDDAHHGWVDLRPENMATWQARFNAIRDARHDDAAEDTSSRKDRYFTADRHWAHDDGSFDIGDVVAWIFNTEDQGQRVKS